jgi:hypothetical protein
MDQRQRSLKHAKKNKFFRRSQSCQPIGRHPGLRVRGAYPLFGKGLAISEIVRTYR